MPKVTKDAKKKATINEKKEDVSTVARKRKTTSSPKVESAKPINKEASVTAKKEKGASSKTVTKKKTTTAKKEKAASSKKVAKKTTTKKEKAASPKKVAKKTTTAKKEKAASPKKVAKKTTTTKKEKTVSSKTVTRKRTNSRIKKLENNIVAEYYDLPYRYNETTVKILYQTPTVLFVYWDISDYDRAEFIKKYGENFFNETKPVLKVFNLTKNYHFEVEINDFANSWYIQVNDANCDYKVELARRTQYAENAPSDYIYVSTSNQINFPNDHILLEDLPEFVYFKNVKTNERKKVDIRTLHLIGIHRIFNVYDFYKTFYKDEILEEIKNKKIINPSSLSSWS